MRSKRKVAIRWTPVEGAQRYGVDVLHGHKQWGTSTARTRIVLKVKPGTRYTAIISVVKGTTNVNAARYRFRVKR